MRAQSRIYAVPLLWLFLVVVYFAFYYDQLLGFLTSLLGGCLILAGGWIAGVVAVRSVGQRSMMGFAPVALILAVGAVGWLTPIGKDFGARCKFLREKGRYMATVAEVADGASESELGRGVKIDDGPPTRIAFSWGGVIDNWCGIVYDPTGEVIKANLLARDWSNRSDPDYASVSMLFGGTLIRTQRIEGDWYLCWFT